MKRVVLITLSSISLFFSTNAQEVWKNVGSGLGNKNSSGEVVYALFNDTIDKVLYAGGSFLVADDSISCNGFAVWDGKKWSTPFPYLGSGTPNISAFAIYNGKVYGCSSIGTVFLIDSGKLKVVGDFDHNVNSLAVYHNKLYAGGGFSEVYGKYAYRIASYDGVKWDSVGGGGIYWSQACCSSVDAMCVWNDKLIVAGTFDRAINDTGEIVTGSIVSWNDTSFTALGRGMSTKTTGIGLGYINTVGTYKGDLYAGGQFDSAGGIFIFNIARWDGNKWHALASGIGNEPTCFVVKDSSLYVGGSIYLTGYPIDSSSYGVLRWDGNSWHKTTENILGIVSSLTLFDNIVYAGGYFNRSESTKIRKIARLLPDTIYDNVTDRIIMRNEIINIYPNPGYNQYSVTINNTGQTSGLTLRIVNYLGETVIFERKIISSGFQTMHFQMPAASPSGLYLVETEINKKTYKSTFVKINKL